MHLSPTEYKLLEFLMRRAGRVVSRNAIVDAVRNVQDVEENTLDAFVSLLRGKVDKGSRTKLFRPSGEQGTRFARSLSAELSHWGSPCLVVRNPCHSSVAWTAGMS